MTNQQAREALVTAAVILDPLKGKCFEAEHERLDIVSKFDEAAAALVGGGVEQDLNGVGSELVAKLEEIQTRSEALDARFVVTPP